MSSPQRSSPQTTFLKGAFAVACAMFVLWVLLFSHTPRVAGRAIGTPLPPIKAMGWLNGSEPKSGELDGKVLVIDAWASWCGPCRRDAPEMVHLYEKYHDQGVEFVGLTSEMSESLPDMEAFLKDTGITWKNGYGAEETLAALGADFVPMVWVVDRQRRIAWNMASSLTLEEGIRQALASQ